MKKSADPFIGRKTELEEVKKLLETDQLLVITGNKGVGKTELGRKFAEVSKESDDDISLMWIDAESVDSLTYSFQELANFIGINPNGKVPSEILEEVFDFFKNKKALFIFDGAGKFYVLNNIKKFVPESSGIKILITSRESDWNRSFKAFQLEPFSLEESLEFLTKYLHLSKENEVDAKTLAETLQNLPLALSKAARYIQDREGYTLADFLKDYSGKLLNPTSPKCF